MGPVFSFPFLLAVIATYPWLRKTRMYDGWTLSRFVLTVMGGIAIAFISYVRFGIWFFDPVVWLSSCALLLPLSLDKSFHLGSINLAKRTKMLLYGSIALIFAIGPFFAVHQRDSLPIIARLGSTLPVRFLLAVAFDANAFGQYEQPALVDAAMRGREDVVRLLIEAGADPNLPNKYGGTALMGAAGNGHLNIVRMLLRAGARVDGKTPFGSTALAIAIWQAKFRPNFNRDVIQLLLDAGADINALAGDGKSPLTLAKEEGLLEISGLLESYER